MKNLFYLTIGIALCIALGCKKNTASSQPTPAPTSIGNLNVDGTAISNVSHSSFLNGGNFAVIAYGANSNPELQVTFSGTTTPTYGAYAITSGSVSIGKCTVTYSDTGYTSTAVSGVVNVNTSGTAPYNTMSLSNITVNGGAGHHTLNATITY